jgi:type IV pilus assembly protein PilA
MLTRINKHRDEAGFTLIELLVVVIIIGILAAIAIPVFLNQRNSARNASVQSDVRTLATEAETYYTENLKYPKNGVTPAHTAVPISSGNAFVYVPDTTGTGFAIAGCNWESKDLWYYDSDKGGLLPAGSSPPTGVSLTCPATAPGAVTFSLTS